MRTVRAVSYLTALREGGSVPAIVEADDDGTYVAKFRGAAQGPRALVAEVIAAELGHRLGLPVPRLVFVEIDPLLARSEPDPELQGLLRASAGLNVGLDYLPGALNWEPALLPVPEPALAAAVVWFDAFITNVDRTARNPNLLRWHGRLYHDRSWRGALLPSRVGRSHHALPVAVSGDPEPCPPAIRRRGRPARRRRRA